MKRLTILSFGRIALVGITLGLTSFASDTQNPKTIRSSFLAPQGWKELPNQDENTSVFLSKTGGVTELITILERTEAETGPQISEMRKKDFSLLSFERQVGEQLRLFGITEWTVERIHRVRQAGGDLVQLKGHYLGAAKQRVFFEEWKFYSKEGFAQITFSEEGRSNASQPKYIESILKSFRPFGKELGAL